LEAEYRKEEAALEAALEKRLQWESNMKQVVRDHNPNPNPNWRLQWESNMKQVARDQLQTQKFDLTEDENSKLKEAKSELTWRMEDMRLNPIRDETN